MSLKFHQLLDLRPNLPNVVFGLVLEEAPAFNLFAHDPPRPLEILKLLVSHPKLAVALMKFGMSTADAAKKAAQRGDFETADRIYGEGILGPEAFAALSKERAAQAEENSFPEEILGSGFSKLDPEVVRQIECPVLVISGEKSPALWPMIADELAAMLPNSERLEIAAASHIAHEDNVLAFNSALTRFWVGLSEVNAK